MKNKKNKKFVYRSFSILFCLLLSLSLILPFTFKTDNVNADSTQFINQTEFNISLGSCSRLNNQLVSEYPYTFEPTVNPIFLCFTGAVYDFESLSCEFFYCGSSRNPSTADYFSAVPLRSTINSERIRLEYTNSIYIENYEYNYITASDEYGRVREDDFEISYIQVNIPIGYRYNFTDWFNSLEYMRYSYNLVDLGNDGEAVRLNIVFSSNLNFTDTLMSIYLTMPITDYAPYFSGEFIYSPVLKIDRSRYIDYEYVYVEVPNTELSVFPAIINGVNSFFEIEIFPNFTLGTTFLILLGISFMAFLLHIIVK